jgi:magnesium chelatase family protein
LTLTSEPYSGGSPPRPGEISLAHHGVLFLDELPEFARSALEALREPLESGRITISRAAQQAEFPARFQLIAAMNPCPCGHHGSTLKACRCTPDQVARYQGKLSGPLLDRIDLHVEVTPVAFSALASKETIESSANIRDRVMAARSIQANRYKGKTGIYANAQIGSKEMKEICQLNEAGQSLLKNAMEKLNLSARAYDRILKVSRTIADLANCIDIKSEHLAEAIQYRSLDREGWVG